MKEILAFSLAAVMFCAGCAAEPEEAAQRQFQQAKLTAELVGGEAKAAAAEAPAASAAEAKSGAVQRLLGGRTPEEALEYMKNTPQLVIIEVNAPRWKLSEGFDGALWIPYTEMAERSGEIPAGRPVLLHCGAGVVSVEAYETLQAKRPDIPELSYIAGAPPVQEYNKWLQSRGAAKGGQ